MTSTFDTQVLFLPHFVYDFHFIFIFSHFNQIRHTSAKFISCTLLDNGGWFPSLLKKNVIISFPSYFYFYSHNYYFTSTFDTQVLRIIFTTFDTQLLLYFHI